MTAKKEMTDLNSKDKTLLRIINKFILVFEVKIHSSSLPYKTRILSVNEAAASLLGFKEEDLKGRTISEIFKTKEDADSLVEDSIKDRIVVSRECALKTKTGKALHVLFATSIKYDEVNKSHDLLLIGQDITTSKTAVDSHIEHANILQSIMDNMAEGVALADEKGELIMFNTAAEKTLGLGLIKSPAEKWSKEYGLFLPDKETVATLDDLPLIRATKGEEVNSCELFVRHKKLPKGIFIQINARPIKDNKGNIKGAVAVFSDITKIKEDQEALQESEERFRSLIDATFEGIIVYDKGIIMDANNSAVRLFGYENPSIMTGRSILELVAEEVVDDIKEKVGRVTKDPDVEIGAFETTAVKENGEKFYVEVYGRGLMQQGKRVRVIAFRDITERKRAEKELKYRLEFENLITTISSRFINLSPDEIDEGIHSALGNIAEFANVDRSYVFLLSQAGSAVDCTHEWCAECVKPTIDQCQKMPADTFPWLYEKLMHDESVYIPSVPDMPPEAASEREQFESENIQSVVIVPMRARGRFKGFLGFDSVKEKKEWSDDIIILLKIVGEIFVNALAHKNFLEELNKANEDLEKKVEERTRELKDKHIMLINSEKMASLGQLVAGVAHEINTPLGALKSNNDVFIRSTVKIKAKLDELRKEEFKEEFVILDKMYNSIDKLNDINKTAAERITNIVSSLRKFARLDEAEKDTVDIHEGIESTLTLVHHEYKNRITLHKEFGNIPHVNCFPNQLNQVFMNILINAGQAIEDKGDVFIKTSIVDKEKVEVIIEDNGKGIRKEDLKNIFNPGFTTKGVGVGTGLGLSIVYQIIKDHNGKIEIDSEVGIGTSVRILLPVK